MDIDAHSYKRDLTHDSYSRNHSDEDAINSYITDNIIQVNISTVHDGGYFEYLDLNYGVRPVRTKSDPVFYGGVALLIFTILVIPNVKSFLNRGTYDGFSVLVIFITIIAMVFCTVYYFKMPKKEFIWNRKDGRLTFPGTIWNENITMPIESIAFGYSGPSSHGTGAYQLLITRPDKISTGYNCSTGHTAYEDLSFLLWYMDKNRPLPPGTAFDPYRQKDFDRRKAEGFPNPLFPARFETPEATPKQQAERKQIGGW